MLDIIQSAGWPVWPLLATSVVGVALIIERALALRRSKVIPRDLYDEVISLLRRPQITPDIIDSVERDSPLGAILATALRNRHQPYQELIATLEETGRVIAHDLYRYLGALGTIAALGPLLGLLGTVIGLIEIFGAWSPVGGDPTQLARGISIALYNTALGILVAIPAVIFQRLYRGRVADLIIEMEQLALRLVRYIHSSRSREGYDEI